MGQGCVVGAWAPCLALLVGGDAGRRGRGRARASVSCTEPEGMPPQPASVGLLYDASMAQHRNLANPSHPEQPLRIVRIFETLEEEGLAGRCTRVPCRRATREELELKHTREHVQAMLDVEAMTETEATTSGNKYNSVFLCPESAQAGLLSAGSVIEAAEWVCRGDVPSALCVVRPPGHHAECGCAMGFCMFGNVAVAAANARKKGLASRILIVDWDVHHGNGTQRMFDDDPTVLYFSTHRHDRGKFYPGSDFGDYTSHGVGAGEGYSVNVPWDVKGGTLRGCPSPGDAEAVAAFEQVLLPIAKEFDPDLVLVSAGFDAAEGDPLGGCRITPGGFYELTRMLMTLANGRLVIALEGGYSLSAISASMAACARALLGDPCPQRHGSSDAAGASCVQGSSEAAALPPLQHHHAETLRKVTSHFAVFWPSLRQAVGEQPEQEGAEAMDPTAVPAASLQGSGFEMQLTLRQYADASGGSYDDLRLKHEALVFKLEDLRPLRSAAKKHAVRVLSQSFAGVDARPFLLRMLPVSEPSHAVGGVRDALDAGVHGVWLVGAPPSKPQPEPRDGAASAQLRMLADCFAAVHEAFPNAWVGLKVSQLSAANTFQWVADHCCTADAVWLEDLPCLPAEVKWELFGFGPLAKELAVRVDRWLYMEDQLELQAMKRARQRSGWLGLVFGSVASTRQKRVHHEQDESTMGAACRSLLCHWAKLAMCVCDVLVTDLPHEDEPGICPVEKLEALGTIGPLALARRGDGRPVELNTWDGGPDIHMAQ